MGVTNVSRVRGFVPSKSLAGTPWQSLVRQYPCDTPATAVFIGDAVTITNGEVVPAVSGGIVAGVVVAIGSGNTQFDQVNGYFNADNLGKRHLDTTEVGTVGIVPADLATFNVFDSGVNLALAMGSTADLNPQAGSAITGNSGHTITTAANADVRVVEMNTSPDNDSTDTDAQYIVQFTNTLLLGDSK